jgi:hypothetical protein
MFPKQPYMDFKMKRETVEEYLKRGGKIDHLEDTLNGLGSEFKIYAARETTNKITRASGHSVVRDWAVREGIIL